MDVCSLLEAAEWYAAPNLERWRGDARKHQLWWDPLCGALPEQQACPKYEALKRTSSEKKANDVGEVTSSTCDQWVEVVSLHSNSMMRCREGRLGGLPR